MNLKEFLFASIVGLTMVSAASAQSAPEKTGKVPEGVQQATKAQQATENPEAAAPPNNSVDANTLDIAGVKLGMGYEEAWQAAAKHYKVSVNELKSSRLSGKNAYVLHPLTDVQLSLDGFYVKRDGTTLTVRFLFRLPEDRIRPTAVSEVTYAVDDKTDDLKDAAIKKYGQPSATDGDGNLTWCVLKTEGGCDEGSTVSLKGSELKLDGVKGRRDAIDKFVADAKKAKIDF